MKAIPAFAPLLERFFTQRLMQRRQASPHTISSYRDTFRLLLKFASEKPGRPPSELDLHDIDTPLIVDFLDHLQRQRRICARIRNLRLTTIYSFFRFVAFEEPTLSHHVQRVLAIPAKRFTRKLVGFLTPEEVEAHVRVIGKGRKELSTPLARQTVAVLKKWLKEPARGDGQIVFPNARGARLSADGVQYLLARYCASASQACASLRKKHLTPHMLRHTTAMDLLCTSGKGA